MFAFGGNALVIIEKTERPKIKPILYKEAVSIVVVANAYLTKYLHELSYVGNNPKSAPVFYHFAALQVCKGSI